MLIYLNTWYPCDGTVWEQLRGVTLMEVCHQGQALMFQKMCSLPSVVFLPPACESNLEVSAAAATSCLYVFTPQSQTLALWKHMPKPTSFFNLLLVLTLWPSNRKVTNAPLCKTKYCAFTRQTSGLANCSS